MKKLLLLLCMLVLLWNCPIKGDSGIMEKKEGTVK